MVALLIGLVVAVAIAVVTLSVMAEIRKPATESSESRRSPAHGSNRRRISAAAPAVVVTKGARVVVDSGRQLGHNLAELARSSIAIAPAPAAQRQPEADPDRSGPDDEVRSAGTVVPLTAVDAPTPAPPPGRPSGPPSPAPAIEPVSIAADRAGAAVAANPPPGPPRGRAVPSSTRAAASIAAARQTAAPLASRREPHEEYELIVPSPNRKRERLYPPWWKRITSFVILGGLTLVVGLAVGTALGALLAFLYRVVQSSL